MMDRAVLREKEHLFSTQKRTWATQGKGFEYLWKKLEDGIAGFSISEGFETRAVPWKHFDRR